MPDKTLQIVAFNNPYPANYGGVIDIYYKIKALHELGVKIHLHYYTDDRHDISGLVPICATIDRYDRGNTFFKHFSIHPFCVISRSDKTLAENLTKYNSPILFESLRTTSILQTQKIEQKVSVRCHNIEHDYSWGLYRSETNIFKKIAFALEAIKLKYYEKILNKADNLLLLSQYEFEYFDKNFSNKAHYIPVFHEHKTISSTEGFGEYALYHGDLSVADNIKSAFFIIDVFKDIKQELIIASSVKIKRLLAEIEKYDHIKFVDAASNEALDHLIANAHINTLFSFQKSGTKLKVFNALYKGRHCVLNKNMVDDPEILKICEVVNTKAEYRQTVEALFSKPYIAHDKRQIALEKYSPKLNAQKIIDVML